MYKKFLSLLWICFLTLISTDRASCATDQQLALIGLAGTLVNPAHREALMPIVADFNRLTIDPLCERIASRGYLRRDADTFRATPSVTANVGWGRDFGDLAGAAVACWGTCDVDFDRNILEPIVRRVEGSIGHPVTPEFKRTVREEMNPGSGTVRAGPFDRDRTKCSTPTERFLVLLHYSHRETPETLPQWTCTRYTARMETSVTCRLFEKM